MSHHHHSTNYFQKPENALRRARELQTISSNGDNAALTLLHDVLSHRRHKTWSPAYEQIMLLYLDLCLKKNKFREAKDGLHQYRNVSQSQAPGSLEIVIRYLMEKAELKCRTAKECAEEMAAAGQDDAGTSTTEEEEDDDILDDLTTHQSILLSTMSLDPGKTQRETAVVLPSLKFLWETYRAILDILRSNSKLEHLYHSAANRALEFCKTYNRRMEFRRLSDMLRMHLGNLQKYGGSGVTDQDQGAAGKMNSKVRGWEGWTTESIELHLQTRFTQLETATHLHLYTEGFRTVEDIYNIMQISCSPAMTRRVGPPAPPKAKLMAIYYEKLTTLFWVSENHLFHAFAWYKYYTLCKEYNRAMTPETKQLLASTVLLSAICIPQTAADLQNKQRAISLTSDTIYQLNEEETVSREKMARMATLLGFHTKYPTREALLNELKRKSVLTDVPDYMRSLYDLLEKPSSDPLSLFKNARPVLKQLQQESFQKEELDPPLAKYVKPLTHILLLKLIIHLSSAYYTVSLPFLKQLTSSDDEEDILNMSFQDVERAIVLFSSQNSNFAPRSNGGMDRFGSTKQPAFSVKIDHRTQSLRFLNATSRWEQGTMRFQLTSLAKSLHNVVAVLDLASENYAPRNREAEFDLIRSNSKAEHHAIHERKNIIEKRKEEVERLAREKLRLEMKRKVEEETKRKREEALRLERERKTREAERQLKIQKEIEVQEKKKYLKALGKQDLDEKELEKVDAATLAKEHSDKASKKKEVQERIMREKSKKLDYLIRATRIEEIPLIQKREEEALQQEKTRYEKETVEKAKNAKLQWQKDVEEKKVINSLNIFNYIEDLQALVMERKKQIHESLCLEAEKQARVDASREKQDRARDRRDKEVRLKAEEEKRRQEEEKRRQEEEKRRQEEEESLRRGEEKKRKQQEEEKRRQAEVKRMQEEQLRKERERQEEVRPPPPSKDLDSAKTSDKPLPSSAGKYVPPGGKNRTGGASLSSIDRERRAGTSGGQSRWSGLTPSSEGGYKGDRFTPGSSMKYDSNADRDRDHNNRGRDDRHRGSRDDRDRGRDDRDRGRDRNDHRSSQQRQQQKQNSRWT